MKVAFISFEYPPDTGGGGIGTYVLQASEILCEYFDVFLFCGTHLDDYEVDYGTKKVFRVNSSSPEEFRKNVVPIFKEKNKAFEFDIMEGPDYGADGLLVKQEYPRLPYVVRLHTPSYLLRLYSNYYYQYVWPKQYVARAKKTLKNLLRVVTKEDVFLKDDAEYQNVFLSDLIVSPSKALGDRIKKDWKLKTPVIKGRNPYCPSKELINIPLQYENGIITYIGKLSILKGLIDFGKAIPLVLKKFSEVKFRFIGLDYFSPEEGVTMQEYILNQNTVWKSSLEFTGRISLEKIPSYLAETDIVVCPSLWENVPNVVLEAMSAGRIVIATKTGGIPEIIVHKVNGLLAKSKNPESLFRCIEWVYSHPDKLKQLGENARLTIQETYANKTKIKEEMAAIYQKVIEQCSNR